MKNIKKTIKNKQKFIINITSLDVQSLECKMYTLFSILEDYHDVSKYSLKNIDFYQLDKQIKRLLRKRLTILASIFYLPKNKRLRIKDLLYNNNTFLIKILTQILLNKSLKDLLQFNYKKCNLIHFINNYIEFKHPRELILFFNNSYGLILFFKRSSNLIVFKKYSYELILYVKPAYKLALFFKSFNNLILFFKHPCDLTTIFQKKYEGIITYSHYAEKIWNKYSYILKKDALMPNPHSENKFVYVYKTIIKSDLKIFTIFVRCLFNYLQIIKKKKNIGGLNFYMMINFKDDTHSMRYYLAGSKTTDFNEVAIKSYRRIIEDDFYNEAEKSQFYICIYISEKISLPDEIDLNLALEETITDSVKKTKPRIIAVEEAIYDFEINEFVI